MTTASALAAMTDRARFELLGTSVLRAADPNYAAIVHTGLNALGETVVSPIDGLHAIPGSSPPHWVIVQHTTYDADRLRGKWLTDPDSDLAKAASEAAALRAGDAATRVTVVLTSNDRPKKDLVVDAHQFARKHDLALDIWEQSRIAAFLDDTPTGHWLRKQHLGIRTELLSAGLLHAIGRQSLEAYRHETRCPGTVLVARSARDAALGALRDRGKSHVFLVGRSGFGKSVVGAQVLDAWLSAGRLGLWLPATLITESVEGALNRWLHELYPDIEERAAHSALELGAAAGGLLVCVDDVNRSSDPGRLLRLLCAQALSATSPRAGHARFVVPIWPGADAALPPRTLNEPWAFAEYIGGFSAAEANDAIARGVPGTTAEEASAIARRLAGDPFLLGLFSATASGATDVSALRAAADDAVARYVDRCVADTVAAGSVGSLLAGEVRTSLRFLGRMMLEQGAPVPAWDDVVVWCEGKPDVLTALRGCAGRGDLLVVDTAGRLQFRHDRLREWLLVRAATHLLATGNVTEPALSDPYFSSSVAESLLDEAVPLSAVSTLTDRAPWLLFSALPLIRDWGTPRAVAISDAARQWAETRADTAGDSLVTAISWSLFATDEPRAIAIIDGLGGNPILHLAGLRNGSARHGVAFCAQVWRHFFEPGATDTRRDQIAAHARVRYARELTAELQALATRADLTPAEGAGLAALVGHLQLAGFDDLVLAPLAQHGAARLIYRLWVALRCPLDDAPATLRPLLNEMALLPAHSESSESTSSRAELLSELPSALRGGVTGPALACLLAEAAARPDLRDDLSLLIEGTDDPDALEFVARHLAAGGSSRLWESLLSVSDADPTYVPRSDASVARLRALWEPEGESADVRKRAFAMWLRTSRGADLEALRRVAPSSPVYRSALQHRLKLADAAAASELIALLRSDPCDSFWWRLAHRVWCDELRAYASEVLAGSAAGIPPDFSGGRTNLLYDVAAALIRVPLADAEALLADSWGHLRYSRVMIHVAFRVGTPRSIALAADAVAACPLGVDVFEHAFSPLSWSHARSDNPITLRHLRALEPFLGRMTERELLFLAWETERAGGADGAVTTWIRTNLVPRIPAQERRRVTAAADMLIEELGRANAETDFPLVMGHLFDSEHGRALLMPADEIATVLDAWLSTHATLRGHAVVGECLRYVGRRIDLGLLDKYAITGADGGAFERLRADIRFAVMSRSWS